MSYRHPQEGHDELQALTGGSQRCRGSVLGTLAVHHKVGKYADIERGLAMWCVPGQCAFCRLGSVFDVLDTSQSGKVHKHRLVQLAAGKAANGAHLQAQFASYAAICNTTDTLVLLGSGPL